MKKYNKSIKKIVWLFLVVLLCGGSVLGCGSANKTTQAGTSNGDNSKNITLTFSIWDTNQKAGMQSMVDAFQAKNPGIKVNIEVTPWEQYWTKLQASATGATMPDIFWMHPEQVYTYANSNMLMDMTDKVASSKVVALSDYPKYIGGDFNVKGKQYAIPKDYGTLGLWYNKDLFDAAGVKYPDDTWTWDTLMSAAEKLTNKDKGIYGMTAQNNGGDFFYNFIWQNGSDMIKPDESASLYDDPKTIEALKYCVSFIQKGYSPTLADFANTKPFQYFESGKTAMITAGSWMAGEFLAAKGLKCDVAPLPKGIRRASICGGMGYSVEAETKYPEEAWKLVEFLGGEEANMLQSKSGAAISAYKGTQKPWVEKFPSINAQVFADAADYGYSSQYCESKAKWTPIEEDMMTQIFTGKLSVEEGCKQLAQKMNAVLKK